ncbi:MAG: acetyl-CoA carboxylase biotin carboxyl carrier protein [Verrucomicrobiaceae bacterium]|nr:acetyl-CoA carboxylase biotin carboxyl carrier protein [Verrucomicrobiaceae bacterium]
MAVSKKPAAKAAPKSDLTVDLKEITQIVDLMAKNDLTLFHWERGSVKLELRRGADLDAIKDIFGRMPAPAPVPVAMTAAPAAGPAAPAAVSAPAPSAGANEPMGPTINSPMVGTFYRSSSPGEKSFVSVGDPVDENTTVCIIEAMKVMNEIKAEMRGTVAKVLVEDGKPVQYGQPLFELRA